MLSSPGLPLPGVLDVVVDLLAAVHIVAGAVAVVVLEAGEVAESVGAGSDANVSVTLPETRERGKANPTPE